MLNYHLNLMEFMLRISKFIQLIATSFVAYVFGIFYLYLTTLTFIPCVALAQDSLGMSPPENRSELQAFQDWSVRCVNVSSAISTEQVSSTQATCEAAQTVTIVQGGQKVEILKLAISPAKDKADKFGWALVALFPLDVLLTSDFGLTTGKEKPTLYRFRNCNHLGCFGIAPLDKAKLVRFGKSSDGAVYFQLLNGKTVKVVFSLKGFKQAFEALQSRATASAMHKNDVSGIAK